MKKRGTKFSSRENTILHKKKPIKSLSRHKERTDTDSFEWLSNGSSPDFVIRFLSGSHTIKMNLTTQPWHSSVYYHGQKQRICTPDFTTIYMETYLTQRINPNRWFQPKPVFITITSTNLCSVGVVECKWRSRDTRTNLWRTRYISAVVRKKPRFDCTDVLGRLTDMCFIGILCSENLDVRRPVQARDAMESSCFGLGFAIIAALLWSINILSWKEIECLDSSDSRTRLLKKMTR